MTREIHKPAPLSDDDIHDLVQDNMAFQDAVSLDGLPGSTFADRDEYSQALTLEHHRVGLPIHTPTITGYTDGKLVATLLDSDTYSTIANPLSMTQEWQVASTNSFQAVMDGVKGYIDYNGNLEYLPDFKTETSVRVRMRVTIGGVTSPWSNTYALTVPTQPLQVSTPTLKVSGGVDHAFANGGINLTNTTASHMWLATRWRVYDEHDELVVGEITAAGGNYQGVPEGVLTPGSRYTAVMQMVYMVDGSVGLSNFYSIKFRVNSDDKIKVVSSSPSVHIGDASQAVEFINYMACTTSEGEIFIAGGTSRSVDGNLVTRDAQMYNPYTNTWRHLTPHILGPMTHGVAIGLSSGKILVHPGLQGGASSNVLWYYLPGSDTWVFAGTLPTSIQNQGTNKRTMTELGDGRVLLTCMNANVYTFDPDTSTFTQQADHPMLFGTRGSVSVTMPNGDALLIGGRTGVGTAIAFTFRYNMTTDTWSNFIPLWVTGGITNAISLGDQGIMVSPSTIGTGFGSIYYRYTESTGKWMPETAVSYNRDNGTIHWVDGIGVVLMPSGGDAPSIHTTYAGVGIYHPR